MNLTPLEKKVLLSLYDSSKGNGHDFGFIEDARKAVPSKNQLGGVVASLVKKKLFTVYEAVRTDSGLWTQFVFNDHAAVLNLLEGDKQ